MEENEIISEDVVTGEDGVTSPEASETVSDKIGLDELNKIFGTTFKTREDALKSIKETKNFVGKRKEDIIAEAKTTILTELKNTGIDTSNFVTKAELERREFYAGNPQLKSLETIIEAVIKDTGKTREEVLSLEQFKPLVQAGSQKPEQKSIVHSNGAVARESGEDLLKRAKQSGSDDDWAKVLRDITHKGD